MSFICMIIKNNFHQKSFHFETEAWSNSEIAYKSCTFIFRITSYQSFCCYTRFQCKLRLFFTFWSNATYVDWKTGRVCFVIIGFAKTRRSGVRFSRKAREPHTPLGPVSLPVFTLSLQTFRLTARARALLTSAKIRAVLPSNTYVAIDKIITEYVKWSQDHVVLYTLTSTSLNLLTVASLSNIFVSVK